MDRCPAVENEAVIDFVAGTLGGCAGTLVEHPFDTVKVLLQSDAHNVYQFSAWRCTTSVYRHQGIRGLYAGLSARLCISGFEHALIFAMYGWTLAKLGSDVYRPEWSAVAVGGAATGLLSGLVLTPFELLKCRMQAEADAVALRQSRGLSTSAAQPTPVSQSMYSCARDVWKHDGIRGFCRGGSATLLREIPGTAAWLGGYEMMKRFFTSSRFTGEEPLCTENTPQKGKLTLWQTVLSGGISGVLFWTIFFPADVVKTRMQVEKTPARGGSGKSPHFTTVFRQVYQEGGLRSLYRGWFLTILRSFPSNAVIFTTFEGVRMALSAPTSTTALTSASSSSSTPSNPLDSARATWTSLAFLWRGGSESLLATKS